jgi:hypothetical protein
MNSQVRLVYPNMKKERVRTRIRRLFPGAYEWAMIQGRGGIELCSACDNLSWAKPKRIAKVAREESFTA